MQPYDLPDAQGHFGRYGGTYVAETLMAALDAMLARAARNQETDLAARIALLIGLFEPLMLVLMGAVVLLIVLAILLPIMSLNQLVG